MIKYIGSKRLLVDAIVAGVRGFGGARTALDLFSGTARVGVGLKRAGLFVTSNDHQRYAALIARCYVQADRDRWRAEATALLAELSEVPPAPGYFTRAFCEDARYLQPKNGARVDAIRDAIEARRLPGELRAIAVVALMEAADRVDSTTGVQMAYLKGWSRRSHNDLELRLPELVAGPGRALELEAEEAAETEADVAYLDPPYNQHSYRGNYHVWETLARWDAPETYGVANKRVDCKTFKSEFNSKRKIGDAMRRVVERVRAPHLCVSFSDEGYLSRSQLLEMLGARGHVEVVSRAYKRYVGAQIGIHGPSGKKVGTVSHLKNREMIFFVSPDRRAAESAAAACDAVLNPTE